MSVAESEIHPKSCINTTASRIFILFSVDTTGVTTIHNIDYCPPLPPVTMADFIRRLEFWNPPNLGD
jgi:hypothetical protein